MNKTQLIIAGSLIGILIFASIFLTIFGRSGEVKETPKRGLKHGEVKQYSSDKKLKTIVNYNQGIKHGISYLYHKDGETVLLEMPYVNGEREGTSKKYYENGQLYAETSYSKNVLHGPRKLYYSTGQLKAIVNYGYGHPGIGTEEYLIDKTRKEPNEIAYDKKGRIYWLTTKKPCKQPKFYIGKLVDDEYFNPISRDVKLLPEQSDSFYLDIDVYTPSYLQYQDIICSCESSQGNPIVMKKRFF